MATMATASANPAPYLNCSDTLNTMSSDHREAIVRPSRTIRNNIVCKTASSSIFASPSSIIVSYSCVHRVSIGRLRVCVGSILAFYQTRDENRAKLKISYSCGHRVSKSARYDATLSLCFIHFFSAIYSIISLIRFRSQNVFLA